MLLVLFVSYKEVLSSRQLNTWVCVFRDFHAVNWEVEGIQKQKPWERCGCSKRDERRKPGECGITEPAPFLFRYH
jgi:hypothetical protein